MNGKSPTLISGVPKPAPSLATIRSQASAIPSEPASTWPLAATIDGLPSSPSALKTSRNAAVPDGTCERSARRRAKPPRLRAGGEDLLVRGGEHDDAHLVVVLRRSQRLEQLREQLVGERVAGLGVVERDRRDAVRDLVADLLELGHQSSKYYSPLHADVSSSEPRRRDQVAQAATATVIKPEHEAGAQALPLHRRARGPARVDGGLGEEGDAPPPQRVGGHLLARPGHAARRRARLPRPLLPGGVRRTGRRLLLLAGPRRVHELLGLRRHRHGLRRPDRHGPAPRSTCSAPRSRSSATSCPGSRARRSAASGSPSPAPAPTSPASAPPRSATATST